MVWQDIVISLANVILMYSVIHQVIYGFKMKKGFLTLTTSGLTTLSLLVISISFFTLLLYFSAIASGINAILWAVLFIQRIVYGKA